MRTKQWFIEAINMVLILYFFYEGIYKIAWWSKFSLWFHHMPLSSPLWALLVYVIPVGEIVIALCLIFPRTQTRALWVACSGLLVFVLWIVAGRIASDRVTLPFHALWKHPSWFQVMLMALGMAWLAFLSNTLIYYKTGKPNFLRKWPVNAQ